MWFRYLLITAIFVAAAVGARAAYWDVELVYDGELGSGDACLAVSPANIPSVSYAAGGILYRAEKIVGGWRHEPVAQVGFWGGLSSIAFSRVGQPCIAFVDASDPLTNYLRYAYKTLSWTIETVQDIGWLGDQVSLAINGSGEACIAYCRTEGSNTYLSFARRLGPNSWVAQDIAPVEAVTGPALAFDATGTAHIAFADAGLLKVASGVGGGWTIRTVDGGPTNPAVARPSITIQPNGRPALAYFVTGPTSSQLRLAVFDGQSWTIQTAAIADPLAAGHCSVCVTESGMPMICFQDPATRSLKNAWRTDSTWVTEFVDPAPGSGVCPSMKRDGLGNVEVAYFDDQDYNVKFAWAIAPRTVSDAKSLPDGRLVQISGIVASSASDEFDHVLYAQDPDRICGIRLQFTNVVPNVSRGDVLDIQGTLTTVDGERAIQDPLVVVP